MKLLNTAIVFLMHLLLLCSCTSESDKAKMVVSNQFNRWRDRIQLRRIDETFRRDSVLYFEPKGASYNFLRGVNALPDDFGNSYFMYEFYTSEDPKLKDFRKEVMWVVDSGNYVLRREIDVYQKFNQNGFDVNLYVAIGEVGISGIGYRTFLEVDSIPRPETVRIAEVKAGIEPREGYYVCGTAYNEFLEEYFPQRHIALDTNLIGHYLKEFQQ